MLSLRISTFMQGGRDRGTIQPLSIYEVTLPDGADPDEVLNQVATGLGETIHRHAELPDDWTLFVDEFPGTLEDYIEADGDPDELENLIHDNTHIGETRHVPDGDVRGILQTIWGDLVNLDYWDVFFTKTREPDWDEIMRLVDGEVPSFTPERIPLGTRVVSLSRHTRPANHPQVFVAPGTGKGDGQTHAQERAYVPVAFLEGLDLEVEVFPLPPSLKLRTGEGWWARVRGERKSEGYGRTKKDAVEDAKVQAAHKRFWA